jgi:magnesium chelatase subunit I
MLVATANPDDYTNRGRIITPLKDRFGAQVRTHYPLDIETEVTVLKQEAETPDVGVKIEVPDFMHDIIATLTHLARASSQINQRSGVSVRLTVANAETIVANALRRALILGEPVAVPRISDLDALASSTSGKIEIESMDDGRDEHVVEKLIRSAVLTVFKERCPIEQFRDVPSAFEGGTIVHAGDDVPASSYADVVKQVPSLAGPARDLAGSEDPPAIASAIEFILEGLHLSKRLNKDAAGGKVAYRAR